MKLLSSVLLMLCILIVLFVFGSIWVGCSPGQLAGDLRTLLTESRRRQELDRKNGEVLQRIEDRLQVMEAVAVGSLTLFEAAKRFERIGVSPDGLLDDRMRDTPRDEAGWCRMVLRYLDAHLADNPIRRSRVMPPLVQAYRQRFGELPPDLIPTLQPCSKASSTGD